MKFLKELEKGFLSFWVLKYKVTYLIAFIIFIFGIISLNNLPKESDPEVSLPLVTVTTKYNGVSAEIIDDEITEEIEKSFDDIEGIASMNSTSSEGNSFIRIEIDDGYNVADKLEEIQDAVDSTNLPNGVDSNYPIVSQKSVTSSDMFSVILYAPEDEFSFDNLLDISEVLKQNTSGESGIKEVNIDSNTIYDIRVVLSKEKIDNLGLSINDISGTISNNNVDSPIGTYEINGTNYSFKLSGKLEDYNEVLNLDILVGDSFIKLGSIAYIDLYYGTEKINKFGKYNEYGYIYISLTYSKLSGSNIFDVASSAKSTIEEELGKSIYEGINFYYTNDESVTITDDFNSLYKSAIITLILVFIALIFFVGFRESLIATIILPLAFLLSFIIVDNIGETLNQMTSFAFVLAFGIAIDTIIIVVEGAAEKVKQGYKPKTAILIALREFKSPIIIGTLTTISAFIPILTLPGTMGIFLAYIPLVVFITLLSTLFISLTVAGAIFKGLSKDKKTYEVFYERELVLSDEEKELLKFERKGKTELLSSNKSLREKIYDRYSYLYKKSITYLLKNKKTRFITATAPIVILSVFVFLLLPALGFEIFPSAAKNKISLSIIGPDKYEPSDMEDELLFIEKTISEREEILDYTVTISGNKISASLNLTDSLIRANAGLLGNTELQTFFTNTIKEKISENGYTVGASAGRRGPGSANPVGIYLTTTNANLYNDLIQISEDFEDYLLEDERITDVTNSASSPIGEIQFEIDIKQASILGLTEKDVFNQISTAIRGSTVTSIKGVSNDHDLILYIDNFLEEVKPSDIENINIYSGGKTIKAGSVINYTITKTSPSIVRGDGDIQVGVSASLKESSDTTEIQNKLNEFAKNFDFPLGITYKKGGENEENSDLISSVSTGGFVAFFLIFVVLVYQFNSYIQPAVIMYSVIMSTIGVIFGLYITGNPISMPVGIGFISLMGIVVNDAIIMIDKINKNIKNGMDLKLGIIEGSVSRLNPVLVTTITTAAGILPIAFQDAFWAGLGFTIAFGLTTGSIMTLFVMPSLYFIIEDFYKNKK